MEKKELNPANISKAIELLYSHNFKSKQGSEGKVYFLSDKYVVKEFFENCGDEFAQNFDNYCRELQKLALSGVRVPKIYSWIKIPICRSEKIAYRYYILEENVHGREIYYESLTKFYDKCSDICDFATYRSLLKHPQASKNGISEYEEILKRFVEDYMQMNELICSMSEAELDKYLLDTYRMFGTLSFSKPDIFPGNILVDGEKFRVIDNVLEIRENKEREVCDSEYLSNMLWLFYVNADIHTGAGDRYITFGNPKFVKVFVEREARAVKLCKSAMMRMIRRINIICDNPKLREGKWANNLITMLYQTLPDKDADEVLDNVNFVR